MSGVQPQAAEQPGPRLWLTSGESDKPFVPSPGSRLYREYKINEILLEAITEANAARDPSLPRIVDIRFTWMEFFGVLWTATVFDGKTEANKVPDYGWRGCVHLGVEIYGDSFAQTEQKAEAFITAEEARRRQETLIDRIPYSPLREFSRETSNKRPGGSLEAEKSVNRAAMLDLAQEFTGPSRKLIECAANISFACHFRHFDDGIPPAHHSGHLLEVARRVAKHFDTVTGDLDPILTEKGEEFAPKAVAIALALLHDCEKDFHRSFMGRESSEFLMSDYAAAARRYLKRQFKDELGDSAATGIGKLMQQLPSSDEIASTVSLQTARKNRTIFAVKLAELDHELSLSSSATPTWTSIISPAQYLPFFQGTAFEQSCELSTLRCIAALRPTESPPTAIVRGKTSLESGIEKLSAKEGTEALQRLDSYFSALIRKLSKEEYSAALRSSGIDTELLRKNAVLLQQAIAHREIPDNSIADVRVVSETICNTPVRIVGPIVAWNGELRMRGDVRKLRTALGDVACELRRPIHSYLTGDQIETRLCLTRTPERADSPSERAADLRQILEKVGARLSAQGIRSKIVEQSHEEQRGVRTHFGLKSDFYETRRVEVLEKLGTTVRDLETAKALCAERLGDLSEFGVYYTECRSMRRLREELESRSLRREFNIDAATAHFWDAGGQVRSIEILTAAPATRSGSLNFGTEFGFLVDLPSSGALAAMVEWADKMRLSHFGFSHAKTREAYRVELPKWS